jgi:hypothetical protein
LLVYQMVLLAPTLFWAVQLEALRLEVTSPVVACILLAFGKALPLEPTERLHPITEMAG